MPKGQGHESSGQTFASEEMVSLSCGSTRSTSMRQSFASVVDSSISSGRKPPGPAGPTPPGKPALATVRKIRPGVEVGFAIIGMQ